MNQAVDLGSVLTAVEDAGLFSSLLTIQSPPDPPLADAVGQAKLSNPDWSDVPGLVGLACMSAPLTIQRPSASDEVKDAMYTGEMDTFHVLIDGYYPQIKQVYRAVIDGTPLQIMGVESDSQKIMTRMACKRYSL